LRFQVSDRLIMAEVRHKALTTTMKPSDIVAPILNSASKLVALPSSANLKRTARRVKKIANLEPPNPCRLEDFAVPDELKDYDNGLFSLFPVYSSF
jgi:hypothetical protein